VSAEQVALAHYEGRRRLIQAAASLARAAWARVDLANLDPSWLRVLPLLQVGLAGAQLAAAQAADNYADNALAEQGVDPRATGRVNPSALAGIASDGRPLASLLLNPITVVKASIAQQVALDRAMAAGYANLDMLVRTQVADAGRAADQVAIASRRTATGYVRMLVGKSCSRCVVLAGRRYQWNAGFKRHPRCDCVHVPAAEDRADDIRTNPRGYFDGLTRTEQDKAFTKAGAEAIRNGADIGQAVNARRGMQTATVYGREVLLTTEGTTLRGEFGGARRDGRLVQREGQRVRSTAQVRLMPEQILLEARGSRDEAVRLLRLHGYIR
jgi:hypothetical protein